VYWIDLAQGTDSSVTCCGGRTEPSCPVKCGRLSVSYSSSVSINTRIINVISVCLKCYSLNVTSAIEDSHPLEYDAVSQGVRFLSFRRNQLPSS
jgi:hypothetical protein